MPTGETWIFDLETRGFLPNLKSPSDLFIIVAQELNTNETVAVTLDDCEPFARRLYEADKLIAHNGWGFDFPALTQIYDWWDRLEDPRDSDSIIEARLAWPHLFDLDQAKYAKLKDRYPVPKNLFGSHSLKAWGLRLGEHKGDYDQGFEEYCPEMLVYAKQDIVVTRLLWDTIQTKNVSKNASDLEQAVARLMARQERTGFPFDSEAADGLLRDLQAEQAEIMERLQAAFPPWSVKTPFIPKANNKKLGYVKGELTHKVKDVVFNPSSRDHIADRLKTLHGWEPSATTPQGKPRVDEAILSELDYPEARLLARNFLLDKRIGQLATGAQAWIKKVADDGRIHGRVLTLQTISARASHTSPNIAQVPGNNAPFGERCRKLFTAPEGRVLVGSDLSGIEIRALSHYLAGQGDPDYAKEVVEGDIHTRNQKAAGLSSRAEAKSMLYATLYGAGVQKLGAIVGGTAKDGAIIKDRFYAGVPALGRLVDQINDRIDEKGFLIAVDKRRLYPRSKHSALNLLLQNCAAVIAKAWIVKCDELFQQRDLDVQWHAWVHDEIQVSCPPSQAELVGQAAQDAVRLVQTDLNIQCQLDTDFNVGASWAETH